MAHSTCRVCKAALTHTFLDLGVSPLANSFLTADQRNRMEPFYPLHAYVCDACLLVQLGEYESPQQIFSHYLYASSYSSSWLKHAEAYAEMVIERFQLNSESQVIEVASNDGYLLQYFHDRSIRALGVEPASNVAELATGKGIPTRTAFFGEELAKQLVQEGSQADLLVANNVLAHVPDLHDFAAGLKRLLRTNGVITIEFPHLLELLREQQFDTIYHEHFSYFSLRTAQKLLAEHGLEVVDVDQLPTHGGSLRLYAKHVEDAGKVASRVAEIIQLEQEHGLDVLSTYTQFSQRVGIRRREVLSFFTYVQAMGKSIVGYGAPAKGNTFLNYCGISKEWLPYTVDQSPHKQNLYLPGTRIPIKHPDEIKRTKPDYVLILPWNLKQEIMESHAYIRDWGGQFVVLIPTAQVL
ncbi:class I SAM-dependent methyltransferase [Paenibacillus sp. SC116]|uniref:class I SAM-dependent methyltransferase n=1 Tax=Paenibacillus sp. SC116 TaxID=2968986 RepID=UPI00215B04FF|nr:class I SAM-dependent methyltransferase [Paenibacillus sp. SC116]MCR8844266.1 class I SAM-dependent methyltransferase [Paenibacillus sp. SC116]